MEGTATRSADAHWPPCSRTSPRRPGATTNTRTRKSGARVLSTCERLVVLREEPDANMILPAQLKPGRAEHGHAAQVKSTTAAGQNSSRTTSTTAPSLTQ